MTKAKLGLIGSIAVSLLAVSVASVSTLAWFQINSNAEVAQPTQTKNIQTNATVHQSNAHSNDDAYQTSPTSDMGGTLSYDHSKGGKATNYYIRQYGGASEITLQMYTNENNTDDKAVYYNIKFTNKWKIYEASTPEHYYGYDDIEPSDPLLGSCGVDGDRNITIGSLTGYYDVYLTSSNKIWIVDHSETTTSDEMGNETGYYIYGTAADGSSALSSHGDIEHGIPMYVNAAAGTSDLAYYAGLRLSDSDVFYLASGDTTNPYTSSESGGDNLLNNGSYFSFNTTTGAITCNQLGYYCIALTSGSNIHISAWDGMEVDSSTRYTVNDAGGNPLRSSHVHTPKRSANQDSKYFVKGSQWGSWGTPQVMYVGQDYYFLELSINNNTVFGIQDDSNYRGWSALQNTPWKNNFSQQGTNDIKCTYGGTYYIFLDGGNIYIYMDYFLITGADIGWTTAKSSDNELLWDEDNGQWYRNDVNLTYGSGDNRFNILQDGQWTRLTNYSKMGGDLKSTNFQQKTSGSDDDIMARSGKDGYYNLYFKPWKATNFYAAYTSYSVTLNKNGGTCSDLTSYTYGTGATLPSSVTKSGYNFKGWYDNSSFTGSAVTKIASNAHGNKTYWAKFVQVFTVSFAYWDVTNNVSVSGTAATAKSVEKGSTFSFPSVPSAPAHYNLYNSESKWHAGKTTESTAYNGGATSPAVNSATTYYVLLTPVPTCNINYYKSYNGVAQGSTTYTAIGDQGSSFTVHSLPSTENGYTLTGWYTNPDGSGTQYVASSSTTCPSQSTLNLYACYTYKSYNYYLTGNLKGNYSSGSGSVLQAANYGATTVSWSVSLSRGEKWKLYCPSQDTFSPFDGNRWWGYSTGKSGDTSYFKDDGTDDHNIETIFAGTYTITLTIASGNINFTLVTLNADNFTLYQYAPGGGSQKTITASRTSNDVFTFSVTGDKKFLAGYYWHVTGPNENYLWGYKTSNSDNITATEHYAYWFADSGNALADATIHDTKNLYSMTCTVTFTRSTNSLVVSNISLVDDQFQLKTASTTLATQSASSSTGTVTFSSVHLATDTPWYLHVGGMIKYSYNSIDTNVTMLGQSTPKGTYFYIADDGADYIGTGYGGTYNIVFDVTTHVMSITCTNLDLTDFKAVRGSGSTEGTSMVSRSVNTTTHLATYTGSTHLYIGETLYFKNDNTGAKSDSALCIHNYYFNGDIVSANLNGSNLVYTSGQYLYSRVDVTINYTFTFLATSSNTTKANFTITSITENTDISFNHAENAGIYIETATNSSFTTGVTKKMMHTTSGKDMNGNTYLAQEAPIYTASGTSYMRVIKTHSNGSGTTPNASTIRSLTEYYYVAQDASQSGFSSSTSTRSVTGNGDAAYVTVTTAGTWTVSLRTDGAIHIEPYSGASTESTEHEVPYYLIGRGMPGSNIRGCDYTTSKGIKLWTYGGNSSTVPCYVGAYGNNTNSANYVGTGISLKKGDTFALSSASKVIKTFASNSVTGLSINTTTGIVTVNTSGTYRIYLTGSVGSESINIAQVSDGSASDWSRSGDVISQNGVSLISSSGNTLTLGGNLDYSLLDAYGNGGYTFEIELDHVSSGAAGTMYYTITNSNGYSIDVAMKAGNYASNVAYSANTTIANGTTSINLYNRAITASTTTSTTIRITLTPAQIRSMISSGSYSFSMTISYSFTESTIS